MSAPMEGRTRLHSRRFALALAALAGMSLVAYLETQPRKARGQYVDDAAITTKVKAALARYQSLDGLQIGVET